MEKTTKARYQAMGAYAVFLAASVWLLNVLFTQATLADVPLLMQLTVWGVIGAAAMCVWLVTGKQVSAALRNAVVAVTVLLVVNMLVNMEMERLFHIYSMGDIFPSVYESNTLPTLFVVVRILLLVGAAGLVDQACETPLWKNREKAEAMLEEAADALQDVDGLAEKAAAKIEELNSKSAAEWTEMAEKMASDVKEAVKPAADQLGEMLGIEKKDEDKEG